ncbi:MAG: hypothetical protein MUO85_01595, partial [candidate division Zixibacteria bacterium]|nr:hypothetical protein [candidate division Zixibacteria bacterium]
GVSLVDFIWVSIGAVLTLFTFSYLYKDNPFYKFAEHLVVGVSAGYFAVLLYYSSFMPKVIDTIFRPIEWKYFILAFKQIKPSYLLTALKGSQWWYLVPGILGVMMWTRFSKKFSWISRFSIAFYMGIGTGAAIPLTLQNYVLKHLTGTMRAVNFHSLTGIWQLLIVAFVFSTLVYFFFSREHKGAFGASAKVGIWILMIAFGAGFGLTVMGRVALLAERVVFLRDYWVELKYFLYALFKYGMLL